MSTSRFFGLLAALALAVAVVLTVRAGSAVSSPQAMLDQHERHPMVSNSRAAVAEQAQLEYRRGEWYAGRNAGVVALDQHERHVDFATSAEQARLTYRRGEWYAGYNLYAPMDAHERHATASTTAKQAQLDYRRGE
jgi:hypothetical protein